MDEFKKKAIEALPAKEDSSQKNPSQVMDKAYERGWNAYREAAIVAIDSLK